MIKELISDFFDEIEKRQRKKNKHAIATYWVEELQEVRSNDRNHVTIRKATRLYNKYVEGRERVVVKEPSKYLLDFMSDYLGDKDYEDYKLRKEAKTGVIKPTNEKPPKLPKPKPFIDKYKKQLIAISILTLFTLSFFIYNHTSENCIIWKENYFEASTCSKKNAIDNKFYNINIERFKKVDLDSNTPFFINGKNNFWYGKSASGKMEFFTQRGIHPETLKELKPITEHIINKYVLININDKTTMD